MKSEKHNINIEDPFKVLDKIEEVKVNHFFKHKVLQQIENKKAVKSNAFGWLTPQLQLATLGLVLLMNVSAVLYVYSFQDESSDSNLESFAQEYSLQSETTSLLN